MKLKKLSITLTDREIVESIHKVIEANREKIPPEARGKFRDLTITFKQGVALIKGTIAIGFVPMPFEAHIEPSCNADGTTLALRLSKVKAAFFSGNGTALLAALAGQLPQSLPEVTIDGDTVLLNVPALFAKRGICIEGKLHAIDLGEGLIDLSIA